MKFLFSLVTVVLLFTSCGVADSASKSSIIGGGGGTPGSTPVSPTDASLSSLTTSVGVFTPVFSGGAVTYNLTVPGGTNNLTITPTATNSLSTITYARNAVGFQGITSGMTSANIFVIPGVDFIQVRVIAEDGITSLDYTLNVVE